MIKIDYNTRHLRKGDPLPTYNGKLRVYNMRFSPYPHRTILALNAKKIDYEVVNINLEDKPDWFNTKSALGKVPALEIQEDVTVCESLVTVEYLDEVYSQRPLLPKDPVMKAMDKIIIEACGPVNMLLYRIIYCPDTITEDVIKTYCRSLDFIQDQLKTRGMKFLDGSVPGFADYMIWPWFERLLTFQKVDKRITIDEQNYKRLVEYFQNMLKDPAVTQYLIPDDIVFKFFDSYKSGNTKNYDLLLGK